MPRIVFLDLETTSLRHDRRFWEAGLIVRDEGVADVEFHWFVDADDLDLGNADLGSLKIGRFHDRHPQFAEQGGEFMPEAGVLLELEPLLRGAVVVGVNPGFDCETLSARMRESGICPSWNYRLVDARTLAAGALRLPPPWKPEEIYESFGVFCPEEDRHTALGDARLARDLYDRVFGIQRAAEADEQAARAEAREVLTDVVEAYVAPTTTRKPQQTGRFEHCHKPVGGGYCHRWEGHAGDCSTSSSADYPEVHPADEASDVDAQVNVGERGFFPGGVSA